MACRPASRVCSSAPNAMIRRDKVAVLGVDHRVHRHQTFAAFGVPLGERRHRFFGHRLRLFAHLLERLEQLGCDHQVQRQLRQLGDVDALVAHPLKVQVDVQHGEDQPQVGRKRRLQCQQPNHAVLDARIGRVVLVILGDHHVGQLLIAGEQRLHRPIECAHDQPSVVLQLLLDRVELLLEGLSSTRRHRGAVLQTRTGAVPDADVTGSLNPRRLGEPAA